MKILGSDAWIFYCDDAFFSDENRGYFNPLAVGKWMYFYKDLSFVKKICSDAILNRVVLQCKHTNGAEGVACFYINCDDLEGHKKVLSFFLKNNLIPTTKTGIFHNISFKLDIQTEAMEYGKDFHSNIRLENFINLYTGEWVITQEKFEKILPHHIQVQINCQRQRAKFDELKTMPEKDITYQFCYDAVNFYYGYFEFVPLKFRTEEICKLALNSPFFSNKYTKFIPNNILSYQFVKEALNVHPECVGSFPIEFLSEDEVINIAKNTPSLIKSIPKQLKSNVFYQQILTHNGMNLRYIPSDCLSKELCITALKSRSEAIKYLKEPILTYELCEIAVKCDWKALRFIPSTYLDKNLFNIAEKEHSKAIKSISKVKEKLLTEDFSNA